MTRRAPNSESSPSGSSGCSGADARQTDKRSSHEIAEDIAETYYFRDVGIAAEKVDRLRSAVSARSGDGQAWLRTYVEALYKKIEEQEALFESTGDRYHDGVGDGLDMAESILNALILAGPS